MVEAESHPRKAPDAGRRAQDIEALAKRMRRSRAKGARLDYATTTGSSEEKHAIELTREAAMRLIEKIRARSWERALAHWKGGEAMERTDGAWSRTELTLRLTKQRATNLRAIDARLPGSSTPTQVLDHAFATALASEDGGPSWPDPDVLAAAMEPVAEQV